MSEAVVEGKAVAEDAFLEYSPFFVPDDPVSGQFAGLDWWQDLISPHFPSVPILTVSPCPFRSDISALYLETSENPPEELLVENEDSGELDSVAANVTIGDDEENEGKKQRFVIFNHPGLMIYVVRELEYSAAFFGETIRLDVRGSYVVSDVELGNRRYNCDIKLL